jgi:hypothetical protein
MEETQEVAKFDFMLTFVYNPTVDDNQLSCSLICSQDLFDKTTVALLNQRFQYFLNQIFGSNLSSSLMDNCMIRINKLSVILPAESAEMESIIFRRLENTVKEGM